jgi:hypothetical protein
MSSIDAFNTLMKNFVTELNETFPEFTELSIFAAGFDAFVAMDPARSLKAFMDAFGPYSNLIMNRDETLFEQEDISLGGTINLQKLWRSSDISDATRDAIWQYLMTLYVLGSTITSMPPEILQSIEAMAGDCATKVETGQMSMGDLMPALMSSMGSLMGQLPPPSS